jgi:hypothetical protein
LVEFDTANQTDEFLHIDLLERQVQQEDEIKPRSKHYVSSVSNFFHCCLPFFGVQNFWLVLQDEPLKQWIPLRDEYLDELLRLEGRGEFTSPTCPSCVYDAFDVFDDSSTPSLPSIQCQDCFTGELLCEKCCMRLHQQHPLHIIEVSIFKYQIIVSNMTLSHRNGMANILSAPPWLLSAYANLDMHREFAAPITTTSPLSIRMDFTRSWLITASATISQSLVVADSSSCYVTNGILSLTPTPRHAVHFVCCNTSTCRRCREKLPRTIITLLWRNWRITWV